MRKTNILFEKKSKLESKYCGSQTITVPAADAALAVAHSPA